MIPIETTSVYPTRYAAFDRNGVLFVNSNPRLGGGFELAVYDSKQVHGTITVYAPSRFDGDCGLTIEVVKGGEGNWRAVYTSGRIPYNYDQAQRKLIEELEKALA